jgi:tetratricopeptide (TPR) repeat protein
MPLDESAEEEIHRFEEQFKRQPESLVFARLADAYRKAGDPHRALEVLEEGIRRHADYLSAHIVRARTYLDLGRVEDAQSAFERVLELDAQNLVAIQGLAEIARAADDGAAEMAWLERLVLADPHDPVPAVRLEELRQLVVPQDEAGPTHEDSGDLVAEEESWWSEKSAVEAESQATGNLTADSGLASELWSGPVIIPDDEFAAGMESARELEVESAKSVEPVEPAAESPVEEWDDVSAALTDPLEDPELDGFEDDVLDADASGGSATVEPAVQDAWWFEPPASQEISQPDRESIDDAESDDDADLLTRTMAELYARQGLIDEAEAIYRELMRDRPDDETLRDGLDAVLGMRAARVAARAPDPRPESLEAELPEPASEPAGPAPIPAAQELTELLRTGEALVDRLPEPPPLAPDPIEEPPEAMPVLEEWLRGLRG